LTEDAKQLNARLRATYNITARFYDLLDYPWERQYRHWRPRLLNDVRGKVLEAGVGTGRNLASYNPRCDVTAIDLSPAMLRRAAKRAANARCSVDLRLEDATVMDSVQTGQYDWVFSTFMCCVMPDELQPAAVRQFERVLKPGGRFRLLEMVYSKSRRLRARQERFAPFVERVYGARFDRHTFDYVQKAEGLSITNTYFLKDDTYLVIEGQRK